MVFRRSVFFKMFINLTVVLILFGAIVAGGTQLVFSRDQTNRTISSLTETTVLTETLVKENFNTRERVNQLAEYRNMIIIVYYNKNVVLSTASAEFDITSNTIESHIKSVDGAEIFSERSNKNNIVINYMLCKKDVGDNMLIEVRQNTQVISEGMKSASKITRWFVIAALIVALIWALVYSKWFTAPITEMNKVTKEIARLNFSDKVSARSNDEVGQLAGSINEMSVKLSGALLELSEKNERLTAELERERALDFMRKKFVSDVSHELKTPLSIIQGYAEALEMQANKHGEKYAKYSSAIMDETQRMTKPVHDLLNLSNYQSGNYVLNKKECSISDIIENIAEKHRLVNADVNIETHVTPHSINVDPDRMEQIITNLLSNAISHADERKRVSISGSVSTNGYRVSVYNSGPHIKDEDMEKLWTPFYRGDDSRKREGGRYGIGLSIVKALLELHNASFGVQNLEGGVEFYFEIKDDSAPKTPSVRTEAIKPDNENKPDGNKSEKRGIEPEQDNTDTDSRQ